MTPFQQSDPFVLDEAAVFRADDYLYFYESTLIAEGTEHQVEILTQALALSPPARILDVGCGHGRHAMALAKRGYAVTGLDRSESFLNVAREAAAKEHLDIDFREEDARTLAEFDQYEAALLLFDVFGFHSDADNVALLARVSRALRASGRLCIDIRNRDWMVRNVAPTTVLEREGNLMIDRHTFDSVTGRLVDHRVLVRDGQTRNAPFSIRLYTFSELHLILASLGFRILSTMGDWNGAPLSLVHNRMIVFAEKA